jgi:hypothetical protein
MPSKSSRFTGHPVYVPFFDLYKLKNTPHLLDHLSTPQLTAIARRLIKESGSLLRKQDSGSGMQLLKVLRTLVSSKGALNRTEILGQLKKILGGNQDVFALMTDPATASSQLGFMLLEGLEYKPDGIEPSMEVVKSIFLAPGEEMELTKKTWSKVELELSESTEQTRSEEKEAALSSDKELAESLNKQTQFSANMSTSVQATGTSGVYTVQAKADTTLSGARTTASVEATKQHQAMTSKAAARMQQQHKVTYGQKTQFTSEYATVEKIKNPNTTHAVTITLKKLLQKWQISHMSYGARFCLDVMVKNPGKNLRQDTIPKVFIPDANVVPNPDYPPTNAPLPPPEKIAETKEITFGTGRDDKLAVFFVPPGYDIEFMVAFGDDGSVVTFSGVPDGFISGSQVINYGGCMVGYDVNNYDAGKVQAGVNYHISQNVKVTASFKRTPALLDAWKTAATPFVIEEARRAWEANNAARQAQQAALEEGSSVPPAQILRKEERDELFSAVARFLVNGDVEPEPISAKPIPPEEYVTPAVSDVRKLAEALEWETTSCFLYPYWWNTILFKDIEGGAFDISHKNFLRREFARSSWARVMIPVRSGYEPQVLVILYGDAMQKALAKVDACGDDMNAALAVAEATAEPIKSLVKAYLELKDRNQQVNSSTPEVIASWVEYTPTDEITATMDLLRDSAGHPVDIAEPYLRKSQDAEIRASEVITDLQSNLSDQIDAGGCDANVKATVKVKGNEYKVKYLLGDGEQQL